MRGKHAGGKGRRLAPLLLMLFLCGGLIHPATSTAADASTTQDSIEKRESTIEKVGGDYGVKPRETGPERHGSKGKTATSSDSSPTLNSSDSGINWLDILFDVLSSDTTSNREQPVITQLTGIGPEPNRAVFRKSYKHLWRADLKLALAAGSDMSLTGLNIGFRRIGWLGFEAETTNLAEEVEDSILELTLLGGYAYSSLLPWSKLEVQLGLGLNSGAKSISGSNTKAGPSSLTRLVFLPLTPWIAEMTFQGSRIGGQNLYEPSIELGVRYRPFRFSTLVRGLATPSTRTAFAGIGLGVSF